MAGVESAFGVSDFAHATSATAARNKRAVRMEPLGGKWERVKLKMRPVNRAPLARSRQPPVARRPRQANSVYCIGFSARAAPGTNGPTTESCLAAVSVPL